MQKYFKDSTKLFNALLLKIKKKNFPPLIFIAGCSRVGKTTLSKELKDHFRLNGLSVLLLSLDHWIIDIRKRSSNSTVLDRFEIIKIDRDLNHLLKRSAIYPPIYDPILRYRKCEKREPPIKFNERILIVEGVVALYLKNAMEGQGIKIFVHESDTTRKERLFNFYINEKGISSQNAKAIIDKREEEEVVLIKKSIQYADFVLSKDFSKRQEKHLSSDSCVLKIVK